jgi:hypothetical protein
MVKDQTRNATWLVSMITVELVVLAGEIVSSSFHSQQRAINQLSVKLKSVAIRILETEIWLLTSVKISVQKIASSKPETKDSSTLLCSMEDIALLTIPLESMVRDQTKNVTCLVLMTRVEFVVEDGEIALLSFQPLHGATNQSWVRHIKVASKILETEIWLHTSAKTPVHKIASS